MLRREARVYADANARRGPEHYSYDEVQLDYGNAADYAALAKIGRGKYSEVFEGIHLPTRRQCVIKVLKPVRPKKVNREVKILQILAGGPNIIELHDVVHDRATETTTLIMERLDDWSLLRTALPSYDATQVRRCMFEILRTLDFCHSYGIIHRDIKPQNIVVGARDALRVIDWGLAEFYHPNVELNVRVASRYYKGPELLLNYTFYDYSLDLWSLGTTFAGIIFRQEPFFRGEDNMDQLDKIVRVLGTKDLYRYVQKYNMNLDSDTEDLIADNVPRVPWTSFVSPANADLATPDAIDLLNKLLVYDHAERLTAREALAHPYFEPLLKEASLAKQK
eukprot:TRINITY_DN599_c0_g1_i2.p2 TRINITY_DN599_c0_g1~~TRINITY_DN599_c0_g1_i2.p2  ORF type:complete len:336 (-),score=79.04 TRINITY_DN599_c0_g1_i2:295-1302(-)